MARTQRERLTLNTLLTFMDPRTARRRRGSTSDDARRVMAALEVVTVSHGTRHGGG